MKQFILAGTAFSIVAFAPVSSNQCRELNEQVLQPVRDVASFLAANPSPDTLAGAGCLYILNEFKQIPDGAQLMRDLGARGLENAHSRCTTEVNTIRYPCSAPEFGQPRCLPQAYLYCGQWEYSMTDEPRYELAMMLSTQVEAAYDKAQQLCGMAMNRDDANGDTSADSTSGADVAAASKDLLDYLSQDIGPKADKLYGMSCGG